ncbi:hypothetical protein MRS44_005433 [Fusarium solani]|uniref:uncharacterized protein n=1 Tax=Fusarium solani TaxID=169388 RepID=UPI0032C3E5BA|nr:hypothetical protein MRS44_005433 [Fusarium solani]
MAPSVMQHRKKAAALQAKRQALEPGKDPSYLLRQAIYDTVVSHLESNFLLISHQSMGDIQRKLSQGKRVTRLGIPLPLVGQGNEAASHIPHRAASTSAPDVGTESRHSDDDDDDYNVPDEGSDAGLSNVSPRRDVRAKTSSSMFFDGEASKEEHSRFANRFFDLFDEFRKRYHVRNSQGGKTAQPRIWIAILDTSIREDDLKSRLHYASTVRRQSNCPKKDRHPIKAIKNFTGNGDSGGDSCGHGTHVASVLLRLAPDADLYVAKVSTEAWFDNPVGIISAIKWAIDECAVDIINMSFGSKFWDSEIARVIAVAKEKRPAVLFFAAASNFGKNEPRTYPALDTNVIGVYALDGYGNDSGWTNPLAIGQYDSFGTLGLGIPRGSLTDA